MMPRWVVWFLRLVVGDADVYEAWIGDLEEDCAEALGPEASKGRRRTWLIGAVVPLAIGFLIRNRLRSEGRAMRGSDRHGLDRESRVESLRRDGAHAFRRLIRTPSSTALIVAILGVGIGGTTALFSVVESVLAFIGIYGVVSYSVSQRTREIGIRIALGAGSADVRRLVLRSGLMTIGTGVMIGLVASAGLARLMGSLLFEVHRLDPLTYGAAAAGVTVVAVLASLAPVRRAVSVDPVATLGAE